MKPSDWKSTLEAAIKSDVGIMLLLLNVMGMGWYALRHNRPIPDGFGFIVVSIFGGKTASSIMKGRNNG